VPLAAAGPASTGASAAGAASLFADVRRDYRNFASLDTMKRLGPAAVGAMALHASDRALYEEFQESPVLPGGNAYGLWVVQVPLAIGWWMAGHVADHATTAEAGRDLVRVQISTISWTYAVKFAVGRERPNGDPRSFPSGHASSSFATAVILQRHYGWKAGVPAFAAAVYTAASRVTVAKHWVSDVAFGAALGMQSARVVTIRFRERPVSIAPVAVAGGGAVMFSVRAEP
jgi:membrane-associated phospholipid phosphatase